MLDSEAQSAIERRLARVESRVRSIGVHLKQGTPCPDLLQELAATQDALLHIATVVTKFHVARCVVSAEAQPDPAQMAELVDIFDRFLA